MVVSFHCVKKKFRLLVQPRGLGSKGARPPPRNWVHKKIPGCAVELNIRNCAWFGSQISLITAMSFREATPPLGTTHQGLCPWTPLGDFRSPDPLCPPTPNPGYATDSGISKNKGTSFWNFVPKYPNLENFASAYRSSSTPDSSRRLLHRTSPPPKKIDD